MFNIPVTSIKGIGTVKAGILKAEAGIETVEDLLYYSPRRYLDRSNLKKIIDAFNNEEVTVSGRVISVKIINARKTFLQVDISDGSEVLSGIFFGGLNFFKKIFLTGEEVVFSGKVIVSRRKQIFHPEFDFVDGETGSINLNTGRIIPLYRSSMNLKKHGLDSRGFRRIIRIVLSEYCGSFNEFFSPDILLHNNLPEINYAIQGIHFPESPEHAEISRKRLAFNEVFSLQYFLLLNKRLIKSKTLKPETVPDNRLIRAFIEGLDFKLTRDQYRAIDEIKSDIFSCSPMNRLLQGDVGSGKTAVALATSIFHIAMGHQVVLMAPTEILARQHFENAGKYLPESVACTLLTGTVKPKEKEKIYREIADGSVSLIVGTHALIQPSLKFKNLGYIIIDEQHRFGVKQRGEMRTKGDAADLLVMTATPIPRSLSMTLYGDMDVSYIKEKPSNRLPVKTMAFTTDGLPRIYRSITKYLEQGHQVYYVLPLIDESDKSELKSAVQVFNHLKSDIFPERKIAIIHSKIPQNEKDEIITRFRSGAIDILVSTTVIEVGIDVPNASIMVIEHAERFGLSQLHQLRGRVGRGAHQSFCILVHSIEISPDATERIKIMTESDDGFAISEKDLILRGSGQLVGTRQHGATDFEFTDLSKDFNLIVSARAAAENMVNDIEISKITGDGNELDVIDKSLYGVRIKRVLEILS